MCARFENMLRARALAEAIEADLRAEAESIEPQSDIRPTNRVLAIGDFGDGRIAVGPAIWGVETVVEGKQETAFNARTDRLDISPLWRGIARFWLPATAWIEWQEFKGWRRGMRKPKFRMANPSGEPFLLKGVGRVQGGVLRVAFMMQDAPEHLTNVHERAPLPYPLTAARDPAVPSNLSQMVGVKVAAEDEGYNEGQQTLF